MHLACLAMSSRFIDRSSTHLLLRANGKAGRREDVSQLAIVDLKGAREHALAANVPKHLVPVGGQAGSLGVEEQAVDDAASRNRHGQRALQQLGRELGADGARDAAELCVGKGGGVTERTR